MSLCLVVGDAPCKWQDTLDFLSLKAKPFKVCCVNHVGKQWPKKFDYWVSWHSDQLAQWVHETKIDAEPWSSFPFEGVNYSDVAQPYGSSSMAAVQIMLDTIGFDRVVLVGVPLSDKYEMYQPAWPPLQRTRGDRIRSMSGYTAELFGVPDVAFVR